MNTKTLGLIIGIVAVIAVIAIAIGCVHTGSDNQDKVTDGVNYYGNGGTYDNGETVFGLTSHTVMKNLFSKDNARFVSWNTKSDGSGTTYHPGDNIDYKDGTSVRLYAIWDSEDYLIYSAIGGTGYFTVSYDGKILSSGDEIRIPSSREITLTITPLTSDGKLFLRNDYQFEYRIIEDGKVHCKRTDFSLTGNANYEMNTDGATGTYTITCTGSGDVRVNVNTSNSTIEEGVHYMINTGDSGHKVIISNVVAENMFVDTGKKFLSWNTARDGSGTAYSPGDTIEYYGYIALYAQWE